MAVIHSMTKSNFAYFTGTNRTADVGMAATMLASARAAGVQEDFHLFAPTAASGFIHHAIWPTTPWRDHMAKLDLLRKLADTEYDYLVWLDSDNYFIRHPGDLIPLIRTNKCWVSMESDLSSPLVRRENWWGMLFPEVVELMREQSGRHQVFNTNGGMWICRRQHIAEFADKCESVYAALSPGRAFSDEPPLAAACMSLTPDYQRNTIENTAATWAIDWGGRIFKNRIPDGNSWLYEDWLTGEQRSVNPAIVHAMGSKQAMRDVAASIAPKIAVELVGTALSEIFKEVGIVRPACSSCTEWMEKMDAWGVSGCLANRKEILHRLAEASDTVGWIDMMRVVKAGYFSTAAMLDAAMVRAAKKLVATSSQPSPVLSP